MPDPIPAPTPSPAQGDPRLFRLGLPDGPGLTRRVAARVAGPLEWLLSVDQLNDTYARCRGAAGLDAFLARVLESLDVRYRVAQPDLDRIPKAGPVVVVANHPFGALDGIVLAAVLRSVRPDVKVMANYLLGRIPDLRDLFILVDPFGGDGAAAANLGPVRQSLRWLKDRGGMLAAFPAGEVAHLNLRERAVTDPPWTDQIARIVRRTGAPVLPVYFDGHNGPLFQFLHLSSFAEQMLVHEHALVKIRDEMPLDRAALIGCGVTTGLGAVFNTARVGAGETVAVLGAGGIGLNAIQGAAIAGAGRIIAVDMNETKLKLAESFGATDLVDAGDGDPVAQVMELTGGGVHHAFEAIGLKLTAEQSLLMLRSGGTATVIGMVPLGQNVELPGYMFLSEKKIQGSNMGSNRFRTDMPRYVDMYLDGKLKLDELVSARRPLEEINEAFTAMKGGEVARSVITFD